jgi:hypothetical protein
MRVSLVATAWLARVALPLVIWDTPLQPDVHFRSWRLVSVLSFINSTKAHKSRYEVSYRRLHCTGVEFSLCREKSPRSTWQHPVLFMPFIRRGAAGVDLLSPHYSWDQYGNQKQYKNRSSGPKGKEGFPLKEIPKRNTSPGAGSSRTPLRGSVATSKPAVEISAKGRDEPVARNLP